MAEGLATPQDILDFWYTEPVNQQWFKAPKALDDDIRQRFEPTFRAALEGELDDWGASADGALALAIVLDQFPLNMYRGQLESFSGEAKAITACRKALANGFEKELPRERVAFLIMPLMHSENLEDQDLSVATFAALGIDGNLRFAKHHRELIRRFGRFPHRNVILGRDSSVEELAYLSSKEAFTG